MTQSRPTVVFPESAGQAEAALALSPAPDIYIPIAPAAAYRLEAAGRAYTKPEDLYSERALCDRADEVLDAEASWADRIDEWIRQHVSDFRETGFQPAKLHFFYLKTMFDAVYIRAHILQATAKALNPARAIHFADSPPSTPSADLQFKESLTGRCLPPWAAAHGIELTCLPAIGDERFSPPFRARDWTLPHVASKLADKTAAIWARTSANLNPRASGRRVLLRAEYDAAYLTTPLSRRGFRIDDWQRFLGALDLNTPLPASMSDVLYRELSSEPWWPELMFPSGLDLRTVAEKRIRAWWTQVLPISWAAFQAARKEFRTHRIQAVVAPLTDTPQDAAVMQAAKAEAIPTFIYQHGGFAGACEYSAWEHQDLWNSDTMLFYGAGTSEYYHIRLQRYSDRRARTVAVGSARLDALARNPKTSCRLRSRLNAKRALGAPLALYFPTLHPGYSRYLCCGELPDITHWELQRDLARLFRRHPGVRLIYRPFAGSFESPMASLLARELPDARIETRAHLPELMRSVDIIITDIPSTGLLEALLTDRPIFVLADARSIRLTVQARELLSRRAFVADTPELLLSRLNSYLDAGDIRPLAAPDDSFLRAYGVHLGDGASAKRAADVIAEAANA